MLTYSDYYPFGMVMHGRTYNFGDYRYGFNGKEKDDKGEWGSTHYDYGFRIYNPQIARFLSVDPLAPEYPWYTPYQFAGNMPIWAIDLDGLEPNIFQRAWNYINGRTYINKAWDKAIEIYGENHPALTRNVLVNTDLGIAIVQSGEKVLEDETLTSVLRYDYFLGVPDNMEYGGEFYEFRIYSDQDLNNQIGNTIEKEGHFYQSYDTWTGLHSKAYQKGNEMYFDWGIVDNIHIPYHGGIGPDIGPGKVKYATELPTLKKGTQAWDNAVKALRNQKGKSNYRVSSASEARELLIEARGNMNRYKQYYKTKTGKNYKKGFERHPKEHTNTDAEFNNLDHIKWRDGKSNGHIFYKKTN